MNSIVSLVLLPELATIVNDYLMLSIVDVQYNKEVMLRQLKDKRYFFCEFFCEVCHDDLVCDCHISMISAINHYKISDFRSFFDIYKKLLFELDNHII